MSQIDKVGLKSIGDQAIFENEVCRCSFGVNSTNLFEILYLNQLYLLEFSEVVFYLNLIIVKLFLIKYKIQLGLKKKVCCSTIYTAQEEV